VSTKDAIFIFGVVVILLAALAQLEPAGPYEQWSAKRRKEAGGTAKLTYAIGLLTWVCIVDFLEFRRGLVTRVGLPEAITWVLAPIGLSLLLVLTVAQFTIDDKAPWWEWVGLFLLLLAAAGAWIVVAGPGSW